MKAHKADQNEGTHKDGDFTGMLSLVLAGTLTGRMRWIAKRSEGDPLVEAAGMRRTGGLVS